MLIYSNSNNTASEPCSKTFAGTRNSSKNNNSSSSSSSKNSSGSKKNNSKNNTSIYKKKHYKKKHYKSANKLIECVNLLSTPKRKSQKKRKSATAAKPKDKILPKNVQFLENIGLKVKEK